MKNLFFISILLLGFILRFYELGKVPGSLDWDEVSLGYNAYSLLLQGKDEYGNSWPLSIRSFNDYKPPAYVYLTIPSVALFGLNEFAVRFPSAFIGTLTIPFFFLLTKEFFKKSNIPLKEWIPYVAMLLFAISPWHLQFSRTAFEANIGLFFVIGGMFALLKYLNTENTKWLLMASVGLAGSLYAYHAPRLVVPLLLCGITLRYRQWMLKHVKQLVPGIIIFLIIIAPLALVFLRGGGSARLSSVSIFKPSDEIMRTLEYANEDEKNSGWQTILHNRRFAYGLQFIKGYLDHFSPPDMFIYGDPVRRHHAPSMGHFYFVELPFLMIGILVLIKKRFSFKFLYFYWPLIAIIPAAISTGTPHAIRSMLVLPIPLIAISTGIIAVIHYAATSAPKMMYKARLIAPLLIILLLYIPNFAFYLNQYYIHQNIESGDVWQYGYKELIETLEPIEDKYDKIIITTTWDQPYIYFLFYKNYDPRVWVNNGEFNKGFDKYEFRSIKWDIDRQIPNALLVGGPKEIPENEPGTVAVIEFPDKSLDVFRVYDDGRY